VRTSWLLALVVVAAVLYLARDVLIPLALAILFAFLLAPAVRRLERWKLGRLPATAIVVLAAMGFVGSIGWVAGNQAISLAADLPQYRANIAAKLAVLRDPGAGSRLARAAEAIRELEAEAGPTVPEPKPLPVVQAPTSPYAQLVEFVSPVAKPAATALAVIVFTVLLLIHRENMRERLIGLIGARRIHLTTQAMSEAGERVSRYLVMLLVMNAAFGVPFGIALYLIGIPKALLWGLLATLLRFIPYAGVWLALAMPLMLAFAISDSWAPVLWVLAVFLVLELFIVYAIEPWLYGKSAGLTPIAVIAAVIFWTWLWGPVGLLLALPITVCVVVMGRYVPQLGFLNVLLGVEPVLAPEARFYQRLVARDAEEAEDLAEKHANGHGLIALHEEVVLPALGLAEEDRHARTLDEEQARFLFDTTRRIVEYVEERKHPAPPPVPRQAPAVCVLGAHDEADHVAGLVLARVLPTVQLGACVAPYPVLVAEALDYVAQQGCRVLCISALPPQAVTHAAYLCKRLKLRFPAARVLVALWTVEDSERAQARLLEAGADVVATRLSETLEQLRQLAVPVALALQNQKDDELSQRSGTRAQ
jgi:predicted PurR-regulated permease PerM